MFISNTLFILLTCGGLLLITACVGLILWNIHHARQQKDHQQSLESMLVKELRENQSSITEKLYQGQIDSLQTLQKSFHTNIQEIRTQLGSQLGDNLSQMSQRVNQQLHEGLEKNASTFTNIVTRLTVIDEAQKKITELSSHVVNLQSILSNKGARGAFGEVQLSGLIQNMIPASHYALQHTLKNGKRADCILFLPEPTGNIIIDAKFPLENYQRIMACENDAEKTKLSQQFRQDIKKHIKDIMDKYIILNETAAGAVMFIPAESVFAEIHANYPDLIQYSHDCNVWLVSPTTLMAVLTTARAVLKDDATRKQVHVIQDHLKHLADDFKRFDKRMQNLTRYIQQANDEATDVHISAKKITRRFEKIEHVDLTASIPGIIESIPDNALSHHDTESIT